MVSSGVPIRAVMKHNTPLKGHRLTEYKTGTLNQQHALQAASRNITKTPSPTLNNYTLRITVKHEAALERAYCGQTLL